MTDDNYLPSKIFYISYKSFNSSSEMFNLISNDNIMIN